LLKAKYDKTAELSAIFISTITSVFNETGV